MEERGLSMSMRNNFVQYGVAMMSSDSFEMLVMENIFTHLQFVYSLFH